MHNLVLRNIVNHHIVGVMIFEFPFWGIGGHNGPGCYRCSIYYYLDSVPDIIVVSQIQTNCSPVANKESDDWRKRNHE